MTLYMCVYVCVCVCVPTEEITWGCISYLKCIVYEKLLQPRQSFRMTLYMCVYVCVCVCVRLRSHGVGCGHFRISVNYLTFTLTSLEETQKENVK